MWSRAERRVAARWFWRVGAGETLGFAVATGVAIAVILASLPAVPSLLLTVGGGVVEGGILGLAQYAAMPANRPPRMPWLAATAGGAAVAWTLGMLPSTLGLDFGAPLTWVLVGAGGILLLASIPVAQALVLRRRGSVRWAAGNAGAWAIAILWTFAPSPFIDESTPVAVVAAFYVAAGLLMAGTIAILTAPLAVRLFAAPSSLVGRATPLGRVDRGLGASLHAELRE